jgi:hypothetical protein
MMNTKLSLSNKIGLGLAAVLGLADIASLGAIGHDVSPGQEGPPAGVTIFSAVLGLVTIVAVVIAWRTGSRPAVRIIAGARILSMILGLPAFFVSGIPAGLVVLTAVAAVLTIVAVALILRKPAPGSAASTDGVETSRAGASR